jgi:hypothetical protein
MNKKVFIILIILLIASALGGYFYWNKKTQQVIVKNYSYKQASYDYIDTPSSEEKIYSWTKIDNFFYFIFYKIGYWETPGIYRTPASQAGLKQNFELVAKFSEISFPETDAFFPQTILYDNFNKKIFLIGTENKPSNILSPTIFSGDLDKIKTNWVRQQSPSFTKNISNTKFIFFTNQGYLYGFQTDDPASSLSNPVFFAKISANGNLGKWQKSKVSISGKDKFFISGDSLYFFKASFNKKLTDYKRESKLYQSIIESNGDLSTPTENNSIIIDATNVSSENLDFRRIVADISPIYYEVIPIGNKILFRFRDWSHEKRNLIIFISNEIIKNQQIVLDPFIKTPMIGPKNVFIDRTTLYDEKNIYYIDYFREFGPSGEKTDFNDKKAIYSFPILD